MSNNTIYKIPLTDLENEVFERIKLFDSVSNEEARNLLLDCEKLAKKLLDEKVRIPLSRLNYFFDPEYNLSNLKKSRKDIFENNGTIGNKILKHGNFVKYLIYWVNGANLDDRFKHLAEEIIVKDHYKDYDCAIKFYQAIRHFVPRDNTKNDFSEEIFKLAIDAGMNIGEAKLIRDKVRSLK
jgi:hypothetical protein